MQVEALVLYSKPLAQVPQHMSNLKHNCQAPPPNPHKPHAVVAKALANPALQNLARSLAYHHQSQVELALDAPGAAELAGLMGDMAHALRTLLCL